MEEEFAKQLQTKETVRELLAQVCGPFKAGKCFLKCSILMRSLHHSLRIRILVTRLKTSLWFIVQINAEAEQWIHVQGVLKNVSVEMATLQQSCLRWEKRALDAENLATKRQREVVQFSYHINQKYTWLEISLYSLSLILVVL